MKKIYLVRHGESQGNVAKVHQHPDTPLSEIGESQAQVVARRFTHLQIEKIISSPYQRAKQTAEAIANFNHLAIEEEELFRERRGPSQLIGLSHSNQVSQAIRQELRTHLLDQDGTWRYSDEETALEFATRSQQALQFLKERSETNLVVVSHALNIRMLLANVLDQSNALDHLYEIYDNFDLHNTGLSLIVFNQEKQRWSVVCVNDHSHLG